MEDFDMPESMHGQRYPAHQAGHVNKIYQWELVTLEIPLAAMNSTIMNQAYSHDAVLSANDQPCSSMAISSPARDADCRPTKIQNDIRATQRMRNP